MIAFILSPLGKITGAAAILLALYGAWQWDRSNQFKAGEVAGAATERAKIQKENSNAGENANRARDAYDECVASGGVFIFATSTCRH